MKFKTVQGIGVPNEDATLWRYMSFARFKQMIHSRQLWFSRIDKFTDFHEGSMTCATSRRADEELAEQGGESLAGVLPFFNKFLSCNYWYASCWSCCDRESNLLWRAYGALGPEDEELYKVAIRTTVSGVLASTRREDIYLGMVNYLDYEKDDPYIGESGITNGSLVFTKRREYTEETEVRLAIQAVSLMRGGLLHEMPETDEKVIVDVDLDELIREVVIEAVPRGWASSHVFARRAMAAQLELYDEERRKRIAMIREVLSTCRLDVPVRFSEIL